jgi:hypothetical protein
MEGGPGITGAGVNEGVGSAVVVASAGVGRAVVAVTMGGGVVLTTGGGMITIGVLSGTTANTKYN